MKNIVIIRKSKETLVPDWIAGERRNAAAVMEMAPQTLVALHNWEQEKRIRRALRNARGVVFCGYTPRDLEAIFRLRASQILDGEPPAPIPSLAVLTLDEEGADVDPSFIARVETGWPFASLLLFAEGNRQEKLRPKAVLPDYVITQTYPDLAGLMDDARALRSRARADQKIGVQVQAAWKLCGSSTAFANEIDCLLERDLFVIRLFHSDFVYDHGTVSYVESLVPENRQFSGAHIEALVCGGYLEQTPASNRWEEFRDEVKRRSFSWVTDPMLRQLTGRAELAIVNHAVNAAFAANAMPAAKIVLDTHDYITRWAVEQQKLRRKTLFPNRATLRKHLLLERELWRLADLCTSVSEGEAQRVAAATGQCLLVLPRPYGERWHEPGRDAEWDLMIGGDGHPFNLESINFFLSEVVQPDAKFRAMRIAISGNIDHGPGHPGHALIKKWKPILPNVVWLGFVDDFKQLQDSTRLSINPDIKGTGISVKSLTAIATCQPMVATPTALRGMPREVANTLGATEDPMELRRQIATLLTNRKAYKARIGAMHKIRDIVYNSDSSYTTAIDMLPDRPSNGRDAVSAKLAMSKRAVAWPIGLDRAPIRSKRWGVAGPVPGFGWMLPGEFGTLSRQGHAMLSLSFAEVALPATLTLRIECSTEIAARFQLCCGGTAIETRCSEPGTLQADIGADLIDEDGCLNLDIHTSLPTETGNARADRFVLRTIEVSILADSGRLVASA